MITRRRSCAPYQVHGILTAVGRCDDSNPVAECVAVGGIARRRRRYGAQVDGNPLIEHRLEPARELQRAIALGGRDGEILRGALPITRLGESEKRRQRSARRGGGNDLATVGARGARREPELCGRMLRPRQSHNEEANRRQENDTNAHTQT